MSTPSNSKRTSETRDERKSINHLALKALNALQSDRLWDSQIYDLSQQNEFNSVVPQLTKYRKMKFWNEIDKIKAKAKIVFEFHSILRNSIKRHNITR